MARLGWVVLAARGWLGPWVALAGLINEGMAEGEPWRVWAGSLWPQGAGWGRGSLWPDLLMKGCRRVKPWRVWGWVALAGLINEGMEAGETLTLLGWLGPWVALAGLINERMQEGETLARLGLGRFGRKGLAGAVGRFGRTY